MAFPSTSAPTTTAFGSGSTTHNVDMPATVNSGDLLAMFFAHKDDATTATTPTGWTQHTYSDLSVADARGAIYLKVADGTEGGTSVNVATDNAVTAAAHVHRVTDWFGDLAGFERVGITGNVSNPNPFALSPSWGSDDTLWLVSLMTGDDDTVPSGYPTNYSDGTGTVSGGGSNNGCGVATAHRQNATATEDPDAFTMGGVNGWDLSTIGIRPAAATISGERGPGRGVARGAARGM